MAANVSSFPSMLDFVVSNTSDLPDRDRCRFSRNRGRWTLEADCELSNSLDLPRNVSLDGDGHTMSLAGEAEGFGSVAIRATGGDIVNLTVDGRQLLPLAPAYFAAIAFAAPGRISHTTVRNLQFAESPHSAIGIEVAAFDGATAVAQDITLESISGTGLLLAGDSKVVAERIWSSGVTAAVKVNGTITATLSQVAVEDAHVGVLAQDQACVRIVASSSPGERVVVDRALIHQDALTFMGPGEREPGSRRAAWPAARGRLG